MLSDGRRRKPALKSKAAAYGERRSASAAASADAELIRMCREVGALERRILAATMNIVSATGRDRVTTPLYRRQDILLDIIRATTPRTLAGCKAVAAALDLWTSCTGKAGIDRPLLEVLLTGLAKLNT